MSTACMEFAVKVVVRRRVATKPPMPWSRTGAHRLVQTRTRTLDGTLRETFINRIHSLMSQIGTILTATLALYARQP